MRKIAKIGLGYRIAARLAAFYLWLIDRTTRWQQIVPAETKAILEKYQPYVFCVFHSRLTGLRGMWREAPKLRAEQIKILVSSHRDGVMIARAAELQGFGTVIGSGSKKSSGGIEALRELTNAIETGHIVIITPDGPRGPNMRVKGGALQVAQTTGVPIFGATCAFSRRRLLNNWDRTAIAFPFGRAQVRWTKPYWIDSKASAEEIEQIRRALEGEMIELTFACDASFGQQTPEPGHDSGTRPKARKEKRRQNDARA